MARVRILSELASGGMGVVHLGSLSSEGGFARLVAIKRIHPSHAADRSFRAMLIEEARVVSRVRHENVCAVLDVVEDQDGAPALVLELLSGEPFTSLLRVASATGEPLPIGIVLRIAIDAARGLHAAHEARDHDGEPFAIVHRDVSPANLFVLDSGVTKVVDFGIARARGRLVQTQTMELKGRLAYLAPEQLLGADAIDRRVDVWALAVVVWEALTGKRLFRGKTDADTMKHVLGRDVPPASRFRKDVPGAIDRALADALCRDRDRRTESCAALGDALEAALYELGEPTGPVQVAAWLGLHFETPRRERVEREQRARAMLDAEVQPVVARDRERLARPRSRAVAIAGAVGVAALIGGVALMAWSGPSPDAAAPSVDPSVASSVAPPVDPSSLSRSRERVGVRADEPDRAPLLEGEVEPETEAETDAHPTPAHARPAATGTLNLLSVPTARVYFRGRLLGSTPLRGARLPAGRQRLELRTADGDHTITVQIRAGELTLESARF